MFIFDKITFNEYCNLVFGILEIHMQKHSQNDKSLENYSRISGYMARINNLMHLYSLKLTKDINIKNLISYI